MTTFAEQIDALRTRMADVHGDESYRITRLAAEVAARDAAMLREIEQLIEAHAQRRAQIAAAIAVLADRIGHLPGGDHVMEPLPPLPHEVVHTLTNGHAHAGVH